MFSDHVLPLYLVCDESLSMMDHVEALNDGLRELCHAIGADPAFAERVQLCLIGFSETPELLLPLRRATEVAEVSEIAVRVEAEQAASNFGAVFTFLRETITRDVRLLGSRNYRIHRPAVFFLSDGQPTDPVTWPAAFAALTEPSWAASPNIVAFGVGDADPAIIARIGTCRAFVGRDGVGPGTALRALSRVLVESVVPVAGAG
jgi:uncharacterized protein YegL